MCVIVQDRDRSTDMTIHRVFDLAWKVNNSWLGNFSSSTKIHAHTHTHTHTYTPPTVILVYCLFCLQTCMPGDNRTYIMSTLRRINMNTLFIWDNFLRPHLCFHVVFFFLSSSLKHEDDRKNRSFLLKKRRSIFWQTTKLCITAFTWRETGTAWFLWSVSAG